MLDKINAIVIGADHINTLGIIRSLGECGISTNVIIISEKRSWVLKSKYISTGILLPNDDDLIISNIREMKKPDCLNYIFPANDYVVKTIDKHYDCLKDDFIIPNCNNMARQVSQNMKQDRMLEIAIKSGFNVPKTYRCDELNQIINGEMTDEDIDYPLFVCSYNPNTTKKQFWIVDNYKELKTTLNGLEYSLLKVQDYVHIRNEYGIEGIAFGETRDAFIPAIIKKTRTSENSKGSTTYAKLVKSENVTLIKTIKEFISLTGYNGIFDIEIMQDDNKYYFIECNFRNGAYGYAYTCAGYNLPAIWIGINQEDDSILNSKEYTLMNEFSDIDHVRKKKVPLCTWIKQLLTVDIFLTFNHKDMKPFIARLMGIVWRKNH